MNILDKSTIKKLVEGLDLEKIISEGFISYSNNLAIIPPVGELLFKDPPGDVHIKYGYIINDKYYVIKIASGFPNNNKIGIPNSDGMMLLFNQDTGKPAAILLDEGYLTDVRTAVAGMICAKQFSNKINMIGIIGTGIQARLQLQYLKNITKCREVLVWGRSLNHSKDYKREMEQIGFDVSISSTVNKLCSSCNLIILATSSTEPILFKEDLKSGIHLTALGADTPKKRELGPGVFSMADIIIADSISQCKIRGDVSYAIKTGEIDEKRVVELGNVLENSVLGRRTKEQITIADLTGVAVQDLKIASAIFESYLEKNNEF